MLRLCCSCVAVRPTTIASSSNVSDRLDAGVWLDAKFRGGAEEHANWMVGGRQHAANWRLEAFRPELFF